jgi:thiol-disulfide isomerase/thioredoxin
MAEARWRNSSTALMPLRKSLLPALLVLLAALGTALPLAAFAETAEVKIGQVVPDAMLKGLNGHSRRLSEFRGRPLLINVWASWCGPCKQEMASLERLAWGELAQQFDVIGISTDDDLSEAAGWLERSHSTISQFIDTRREMENILGASRIPLTVLVGADGRVLDKIYGAREWDTPQALQLLRAKFAL